MRAHGMQMAGLWLFPAVSSGSAAAHMQEINPVKRHETQAAPPFTSPPAVSAALTTRSSSIHLLQERRGHGDI